MMADRNKWRDPETGEEYEELDDEDYKGIMIAVTCGAFLIAALVALGAFALFLWICPCK